ncbi:hypothetical protein ACTXT7_016821, partial [Hymenolepis weldensis]
MRENRLKHLQVRNERRERIRIENMTRLRDQTENAVMAIEEENRRRTLEAKECRNRRMDQFKRIEALKVKEKANRERVFKMEKDTRFTLADGGVAVDSFSGLLDKVRHRYLRLEKIAPVVDLHNSMSENDWSNNGPIDEWRAYFLAWYRLIQESSAWRQAMAENVRNRQNLIKKASKFYEKHLMKMCLVNWLKFHKEIQNENHYKNQNAMNFFE